MERIAEMRAREALRPRPRPTKRKPKPGPAPRRERAPVPDRDLLRRRKAAESLIGTMDPALLLSYVVWPTPAIEEALFLASKQGFCEDDREAGD